MIPLKSNSQSGFALLLTILVLSVVVSVTLAMVDLSLKQLKLAVDSTDSEIAFHAASAGMECARYTRRSASSSLEGGSNASFNCFTNSAVSVSRLASPGLAQSGSGNVYRYQNDRQWGTPTRCTSIDMVVMVPGTGNLTIGNGTGVNSLMNQITGYETHTKTCSVGELCTIIAVTGYSSACTATSSPGVLKRELLLEL